MRKYFIPEKGKTYENAGGGSYVCTGELSYHGASKFMNISSKWEFVAHGVGIYEDGKIDWDYSTNGKFRKED